MLIYSVFLAMVLTITQVRRVLVFQQVRILIFELVENVTCNPVILQCMGRFMVHLYQMQLYSVCHKAMTNCNIQWILYMKNETKCH